MKYLIGIAILASLMLGASAQLLLRKGMLVMAAQSPATNVVALVSSVVTNPWLWIGLFCYGASMGPWLFVLSRLPVSVAYPMVSMGYIIAALMGWLFLNESVTPFRIAGILLICVGVAVIARSA
jgi:multidrug transporter EmrE-like cation transporter